MSVSLLISAMAEEVVASHGRAAPSATRCMLRGICNPLAGMFATSGSLGADRIRWPIVEPFLEVEEPRRARTAGRQF